MNINLEKSQKIRCLSLLLGVGALMLSAIYIDTTIVLFMGMGGYEYLISIYTFLPPHPLYTPTIRATIPMSPIKDLIYGTSLCILFLLFGYFRIKWRWLFHLIIAFWGITGIAFFYFIKGSKAFILNDLIVVLFFILVVVTGVTIYTNKNE